jgi:phenylacetate-CoA ligase
MAGLLLEDELKQLQRLFASPGPLWVPQGAVDDYWRYRHAFAAAGFRQGDIVLNTLSYHLTPGGFMLDSGLRAIGCVVIPAGTGQTDLQVKVASGLKATGYAGTPSFLRTLLHRGRELNLPLSFEVAFATAEMLPESLRTELESFGLNVIQGYSTADVGTLAYECTEKTGMHLQPECIVELLDIETGKPVPPGQPGQVVATTFDPQYPLIRFATGDISALIPDSKCACGRTAPKLKGILGRTGDAVKVKGMFVRGSEMAEVLAKYPQVARFSAIITRDDQTDHLHYVVELKPDAQAENGLAEKIADALRDTIKVRGDVDLAKSGTLSENAKRLDDRRVWK